MRKKSYIQLISYPYIYTYVRVQVQNDAEHMLDMHRALGFIHSTHTKTIWPGHQSGICAL
jgi:hypothetical protein